MRVGLDTSVVIRLITGDPEPQSLQAVRALGEALVMETTVEVSDLVLAETYFALQHHYAMPKAEALEVLNVFTAQSGIVCSGTGSTVLAVPGLASANPGFVDRLILAGYLAGGVDQMLTFEKAAAALSGTRVLTA